MHYRYDPDGTRLRGELDSATHGDCSSGRSRRAEADPDNHAQTLRRTPKALVTPGLLLCAFAVVGSSLAAPIGDGTGEGTEPSPCLTDATIQFSFNPTSVA